MQTDQSNHAGPSGIALPVGADNPTAAPRLTIVELERRVREWHARSDSHKTATLAEGMALCRSIEAMCREAVAAGDFDQSRDCFGVLHLYFNGPPAWERTLKSTG